MAFYCEDGKTRSIFYDGDSTDLSMNLLFKSEVHAFTFQNALINFKFAHPTFGSCISVDEAVQKVELREEGMTRVFHKHYVGDDNDDSPHLSLADIRHTLSSRHTSSSDTDIEASHDPLHALQSLEDISLFPSINYYRCHLVSQTVAESRDDPNNCIFETRIFHQYFDKLNTRSTGPMIAVKYVSTAEAPEDVPVGETHVTRRRVTVAIEFFSSPEGRALVNVILPMLKLGTKKLDDLRFESFLYPENPERMKGYLDRRYQETLQLWNY
jgi:hypothetical protein